MSVFSHFYQKMEVKVFNFFYSKGDTEIALVFMMYNGN